MLGRPLNIVQLLDIAATLSTMYDHNEPSALTSATDLFHSTVQTNTAVNMIKCNYDKYHSGVKPNTEMLFRHLTIQLYPKVQALPMLCFSCETLIGLK